MRPGYKATNKISLITHIHVKHKGVCTFVTSVALKLQIRIKLTHTNSSDMKGEGHTYKCDKCYYKTTNQRNLRIHQQSKHNI